MKITISDGALDKKGLSPEQAFLLLAIKQNPDINTVFKSMLDLGYIKPSIDDNTGTARFRVNSEIDKKLQEALIASDRDIPTITDLEELAMKMKELYPSGVKPGTNNILWKSNKREVVIKLQKFMKMYKYSYTDSEGNEKERNYTYEEILTATKIYVDSFINDNTTMRVLKYFILKKDPNTGEEVSELASILENMSEGLDSNNEDWTTTMC